MAATERAELLDRIHDAATRMVEMVQNLLDANRIERGEMQCIWRPSISALAWLPSSRPSVRRALAKQQTIHLAKSRQARLPRWPMRPVVTVKSWRTWFPMR